jgi:hypothetical protein
MAGGAARGAPAHASSASAAKHQGLAGVNARATNPRAQRLLVFGLTAMFRNSRSIARMEAFGLHWLTIAAFAGLGSIGFNSLRSSHQSIYRLLTMITPTILSRPQAVAP